MHGNFDSSMPVPGAATLEVCGPIRWNGDLAGDRPASSIKILVVTVVQPTPDGAIVGHATPNTEFNPPADEWELDVTAASGTWIAGPAHARAIVRVTTSLRGGTNVIEKWDETMTLF